MRKLVCLLAVLFVTAPALAGDITFTATPGAPGEFTIGYSATSAADVPVGIGIKVAITGSCSAAISDGANVVSSSSEFDVHIDYAHDLPDPNDYTIDMVGQHPLADPCGAGVPAPDSSEFSICMGRLDPCVPASQIVANLVTIAVDCAVGCDATLTVDIEEDGLRGGVVGANFGAVNMVDGTVVCGGTPPCPIACWEYVTQCHGDTDGDGDVDTVDWPTFRDSFGATYPEVDYNPCGDMDHDGDVDTVDWPSFRDNFGKDVGEIPGDCPLTCVWPPVLPS